MVATSRSGLSSLLGLPPATYARLLLYGSDRDHAETSCYPDILIARDFEAEAWRFRARFTDDPAPAGEVVTSRGSAAARSRGSSACGADPAPGARAAIRRKSCLLG